METEPCAPEELAGEIRRFIASCKKPALLEPGEETIELSDGHYAIEERGGRVLLDAWNEKRNVGRRVTGIETVARGRLDLAVERFGKRKAKITLLDQARPHSAPAILQAGRRLFREQFGLCLRRQFPGWRLGGLSTEPDLEHTLSPAYSRAWLRKGARVWAALGAPATNGGSRGALAFGLIWLDYLRRRETRRTVEGLVLVLPAGQQQETCLQLRCMDRRVAQFDVILYSGGGHEDRIDPDDFGNIDSRLPPCRPVAADQANPMAGAAATIPGLRTLITGDGQCSYRVNGLEIGRWTGSELLAGIDRKRPVSSGAVQRITALAEGLSLFRTALARDQSNPLYTRLPEAWLEARVRDSLDKIDPSLHPSLVYGQVPAFAGGNRGVLDLLAVERGGRLVVIELKAFADPELPLQALEYWMRVRRHNDCGDFAARGYFAGIPLSKRVPRLLLVAPALEFHPATETLLRYIDPAVPFERVGVAPDWKSELRVVLRVCGARKPGI